MADDVVVRTQRGPIITLRLNRPQHENRLNLALLKELCSELEEVDRDPEVRAVVLTGTGETFCSGGDLDEFAVGNARAYGEFGRHFAGLHLAIAKLSKPVLAAVNGHARAGGLSVLAICDLAVARESVEFAMPEILSGVWPIMAMVSLNRVLTRKRAFELYFFAEPFPAEEARHLGLVNWVVADADFEEAVRARAERLAALPRTAIGIGRSTFLGIGERSYEEGFSYSAERLVELLTTPEVVAALADRRETHGK